MVGEVGSNIGKSLPRLEAREKVTGRIEYVHHLRLPGMLHGKILRSTVPHGRVKSIDISAAAAMEGVFRVVTIDDIRKVIPNPYYGPAFHDQPILADGKVRFVGEPVAVVLAVDPHIAEEAVQLVTAEYEGLVSVLDDIETMRARVYLHAEFRLATDFADH